MRIKTKKILSTLLFSIMILCCLACALKVSSVASVKADVSYTVGDELTAEEYNIRGGSIKYSTGNNDNGMRIHVRMAEGYYSSLGSKEAGVLIIPEYNLGDNELAYNTTSVLNVRFIDEDFNPIASPSTGESANDKEVLTNLIFRQNGEPVSSKIYNAVFCVRGYVIDGDTIRYTPVWKKAIADVALNFVDDPSQAEHSEELEGYLNTYQVKFFDKDGAQIGETQNVRYGSTFDVGEPSYTSTQYLEYNKKQSDGTFASDEYDFDAAGATVVKKNMHFQAIVHDRTITYGEGISVKDSSGNPIANGEAVEAGNYTVTYGDSEKNHITTLYQDGTKQGFAADYSVNGASKYVCTVDKASVFTTSAEDYYNGTDKKFTATSSKTADAVNARSQGWDSDGYLYGPDINEFSVTPELRMAYNAVFTTKIAFNEGGYNTGVRIAVGSTECRIMGAPNFSGATRNNFVQIANGVYNGSLTSVNYRLDANISNNCADIKLIFDDTNNKIYVFVSGQDFSDKVTITYQPTEDANYARVQLFNACLTGQAPAKFKDWSVSNGADAVAAELAKEYKTYTTSKVIGDYLGMINVSSNVKNNDDESTIFDAVITGESGFKAGVLFSDFVTNIDIGFYVTENMVYGGTEKSYSITSSLTHRLTLTLRNSGAVLVYVDGVLRTGQLMNGFTNGASNTGTYHCYLDNKVAKSVTFANYHFGNHSSVNSSELAYTKNSNGYNVSTDKIARIDVATPYNGNQVMFDAFSLKVKVPATSLAADTVIAGVLIKDNTGKYCIAGFRANSSGSCAGDCVVLKSTQACTATPFKTKTMANKDQEYDLLLEFYKDRSMKIFGDRSSVTNPKFTDLGLDESASYLDIYLVWTQGDTIFGLEGNAIADTAYKTYNSDDLGFTAFSEGYNVSLTKYADIDIVDNGTEDELCSINAHITVPTKTFAGLLVKDNTGAYFAVGFRGDRFTILQSGVAYNGAYYRQYDMKSADDDYDFTLLFTKEHTIKFLTDIDVQPHQGFGSLGLSGSATSVEIYLLWTADNTQFAI